MHKSEHLFLERLAQTNKFLFDLRIIYSFMRDGARQYDAVFRFDLGYLYLAKWLWELCLYCTHDITPCERIFDAVNELGRLPICPFPTLPKYAAFNGM